MNGEHKLATVLWGVYSITVGTLAIIYGVFNQWVTLTIIVAAVGNSANLITVAYSQGKLRVSSQANTAQNNKLN